MSPEDVINAHRIEELLFLVLAQLAVIIVSARLGGRLAPAVGQTRVVGEIVVGLLPGPSLFGALLPEVSAALFRAESAQPIMVMSQVGLILLMFQIGLECDFSHLAARHNRAAVLKVSGVGLVLPFVLGVGFAGLSAKALAPGIDSIACHLFPGTAFAITALPILGRIMLEFHSMLVLMAIFSTGITTPLLKRWLPAPGLPAEHHPQ